MKHKQINNKFSKEIQDLYEICMNKDYQTRPTASEIISLDFMQQWAKELNIMNH